MYKFVDDMYEWLVELRKGEEEITIECSGNGQIASECLKRVGMTRNFKGAALAVTESREIMRRTAPSVFEKRPCPCS